MGKFVSPPVPTEDALTSIEQRRVDLPNGRTMELSLSRWHWAMIEFLEIWNDHYQREAGLLNEFYKRLPNVTDSRFAKLIMPLLRKDYEDMIARERPGKKLVYFDPRK